ncbi:MAG: RNA polymerase sigma-54 factor, partial [Alphaproteobacteria bacterium]|nr:RNA polymerase sigma-54 factor [Alphaproteobacteria bacterium]
EAVRERLRALIENEASSKILSDDKLVDILRVSGVDIARRTVTKYRVAMGIPSSVQRRRAKRMEARAIG